MSWLLDRKNFAKDEKKLPNLLRGLFPYSEVPKITFDDVHLGQNGLKVTRNIVQPDDEKLFEKVSPEENYSERRWFKFEDIARL